MKALFLERLLDGVKGPEELSTPKYVSAPDNGMKPIDYVLYNELTAKDKAEISNRIKFSTLKKLWDEGCDIPRRHPSLYEEYTTMEPFKYAWGDIHEEAVKSSELDNDEIVQYLTTIGQASRTMCKLALGKLEDDERLIEQFALYTDDKGVNLVCMYKMPFSVFKSFLNDPLVNEVNDLNHVLHSGFHLGSLVIAKENFSEFVSRFKSFPKIMSINQASLHKQKLIMFHLVQSDKVTQSTINKFSSDWELVSTESTDILNVQLVYCKRSENGNSSCKQNAKMSAGTNESKKEECNTETGTKEINLF